MDLWMIGLDEIPNDWHMIHAIRWRDSLYTIGHLRTGILFRYILLCFLFLYGLIGIAMFVHSFQLHLLIHMMPYILIDIILLPSSSSNYYLLHPYPLIIYLFIKTKPKPTSILEQLQTNHQHLHQNLLFFDFNKQLFIRRLLFLVLNHWL